MLKRVLFVALIFLSSILLINSANVEIKTYINENFTTFDYKFNFSLDESYSSFSIEKPQFSEIENINYLSESNGTIKYSAAGDFFIFRPSDNTAGKIIVLRFVSKDPTVTIGETSSFSTYLNFNFPVETLRYQLYLNESFGKILEVFPRNYELIENRYYEWEIYNISKDSLFLVNFDSKKSPIDSNNTDYSYFLVILLIAPIILFIILLIFIKNYFLKTSQKNTTDEDSNLNNLESNSKTQENKLTKNNNDNEQDKNEENIENITDNKVKLQDKKIEEIKEKYLTDNEKQIVDIIKKNNGISQNDILNHLPKLTKSNLSKIISKLHSKKILSRIKVGKINKIYLGEKLETSSEPKE